MKWKRDLGLTMRMALTMFLLLIVYLVFLAVLGTFFPGLGMSGLIAIAVVMAFVQYLLFGQACTMVDEGTRDWGG